MHLKGVAVCLTLITFVGTVRSKSIPLEEDQVPLTRKGDPTAVPPEAVGENEEEQKVKKGMAEDSLAEARQQAVKVVLEKIIIALGGAEFLEQTNGAPSNQTLPTVASPLNVTTDPCPMIYSKCSSEMFLPSCEKKYRRYLYFDLPQHLFDSDELLNATLRVYKNNSLPVNLSTFVTELYVYTKSLTKMVDKNYMYDSITISNDFTGWISFDVTQVIRKMNPIEHYGFIIKMKQANEDTDVYWNDPTVFVAMNCSDSNTFVPVPFGVQTDQPEQKYPSLTIHTGRLSQPYYSTGLDPEAIGFEEEDRFELENDPDIGREWDPGMEEMGQSHHMTQERFRRGKHEHYYDEVDQPSKRYPRRNFYEDDEIPELEEYQSPIEMNPISSKNIRHRYRTKAFRKPVENQVYHDNSFSKEDMDNLPTSAITPVESVIPTKKWQIESKWSPIDTYEHHHQESRKKSRSKRRHHNRRHSEREYDSESYNTHSQHTPHHSHSHPHQHHKHDAHTSRRHHIKRTLDSTETLES